MHQNARFLRERYAGIGLILADALILLTYVGQLSLPLVGTWGDTLPCQAHVCSSFSKVAVYPMTTLLVQNVQYTVKVSCLLARKPTKFA